MDGQDQVIPLLESRIAPLKRAARFYYVPSALESLLYERLGVPTLGRYVPNGGSRFSLTRSFIKKQQPRLRVLRGFIRSTILSESLHLFFAVLMLGLASRSYQNGEYAVVAVNFALNLIINGYPIMLQRYNRARALPLLNRLVERDQVRATSLAARQAGS